MANIATYPVFRHLRAEPTMHTLHYRRGQLVHDGPGLAFWFRPINTTAAEVPLDDRDLPFLFHVRSADFQEVTVQGVVTFRFSDPSRVSRRVDFTIDLVRGTWQQSPLEQVAALLTQLAQQFVIDDLARSDLRAILSAGVAPIRERIAAGLADEAAVADLGIEVVAVRVAAVAPTSELEKALQQPTREAIQQQADEASFGRRAKAVEKERAIAENELGNRIELARREEDLVAREGANARRREEEAAAAAQVAAEAADERGRLEAQRRADTIDLVETAKLRAEAERATIQSGVPPEVLLGLALRELAGQIGNIEHLTVTPDLITPLLQRVAGGNGNGNGE
jgi:regulator of protease activity HflC (stomatin/prohibitin superfamily)